MHKEITFTAEEMDKINDKHIEFCVRFIQYCRLFDVPKEDASLLLQGAFMVMSNFPFYDDKIATIICSQILELCYGKEENDGHYCS